MLHLSISWSSYLYRLLVCRAFEYTFGLAGWQVWAKKMAVSCWIGSFLPCSIYNLSLPSMWIRWRSRGRSYCCFSAPRYRLCILWECLSSCHSFGMQSDTTRQWIRHHVSIRELLWIHNSNNNRCYSRGELNRGYRLPHIFSLVYNNCNNRAHCLLFSILCNKRSLQKEARPIKWLELAVCGQIKRHSSFGIKLE